MGPATVTSYKRRMGTICLRAVPYRCRRAAVATRRSAYAPAVRRAIVSALVFATCFALLVGAPTGHAGSAFGAALVVGLLGYGVLRVDSLFSQLRWRLMRRSKVLGILLVLITPRRRR